MGIDIHIHDSYFVVGHLPLWVVVALLVAVMLLGVWKLAQFLWTMLGR